MENYSIYSATLPGKRKVCLTDDQSTVNSIFYNPPNLRRDRLTRRPSTSTGPPAAPHRRSRPKPALPRHLHPQRHLDTARRTHEGGEAATRQNEAVDGRKKDNVVGGAEQGSFCGVRRRAELHEAASAAAAAIDRRRRVPWRQGRYTPARFGLLARGPFGCGWSDFD